LSDPREPILQAATELFGAQGYAGTTMRDIADAVGMRPGSLYAHMEGKEDLLLEIVESGIDRFLAATDGLDAVGPPAERLRAAVRAHLEVVAESPARTAVVFRQWRFLSGASHARILAKRRRYAAHYVALLEAGRNAGEFDAHLDSRIAVLSILGALNWTAEWLRAERPLPAWALADRLTDVLLGGLAAAV
jgi:AcrR family transcriptional regulator